VRVPPEEPTSLRYFSMGLAESFEIPTISTRCENLGNTFGQVVLGYTPTCRSTRADAWDGTDGAQGFSECKSSDHRCGLVGVARVLGHPGTSVCTTTGSASNKSPGIVPTPCRITRVEPPCDARSLLRHLPQPTTRDSGIEVGRSRCRQPRRKR
jgi:hypothetical protein